MSTLTRHLLVLGSFFLGASFAVTAAHARVLSNKKNPTSKIYVADLEGQAQINTGEKIEDLTKKSVHDAQGSIIETMPDSTNAMVFSNGTGAFFDEDTRLEVRRFVQEPFTPNRTDMEVEPSISNTSAVLRRGTVGLCTPKMVAGSVMNYFTSHGSISVRGRKVVIESKPEGTVVSLIEGDVTVRGGELDMGGQTLRQGQQALLTPNPAGGPSLIKIQDIPADQAQALDNKVTMACMAKNTVYFDTVQRREDNANSEGDTNEIVARPVVAVPSAPPPPISPSRLDSPTPPGG